MVSFICRTATWVLTARVDGVDVYAVLAVVEREGSCQVRDESLGRRVGSYRESVIALPLGTPLAPLATLTSASRPDKPIDATDVDDPASISGRVRLLLHHLPERVLAAQPDRLPVHGHRDVP